MTSIAINFSAHWYLAIICFPGLKEPEYSEIQLPNFKSEVKTEVKTEVGKCETSSEQKEEAPIEAQNEKPGEKQQQEPDKKEEKDMLDDIQVRHYVFLMM